MNEDEVTFVVTVKRGEAGELPSGTQVLTAIRNGLRGMLITEHPELSMSEIYKLEPIQIAIKRTKP